MEVQYPHTWGLNPRLKTAFVVALLLAAVVWIAKEAKEFRYIGTNPNQTRAISVTGESRKFIKADVATVQVTVVSDSGTTNLAQTQDRNSQKANDVVSFLKSEGVKEEDVKTTNYSIYPRYNYSERGQEFLGYTIRQDLQIKIRDLNKVGTILNGVVSRGANEVSGLQFTVDDPKKVIEEARAEAIKEAKEKAARLASDLGVDLVRLSNYSESGNGETLPTFYAKDAALERGGGPMPDVQVGQNEIQTVVTLTYEVD